MKIIIGSDNLFVLRIRNVLWKAYNKRIMAISDGKISSQKNMNPNGRWKNINKHIKTHRSGYTEKERQCRELIEIHTLTNWSELFSWLELLFWWFALARGGVDDEHAFILGGVEVGELPEQPIPLTVCWYIIESPANNRNTHIVSIQRIRISEWIIYLRKTRFFFTVKENTIWNCSIHFFSFPFKSIQNVSEMFVEENIRN